MKPVINIILGLLTAKTRCINGANTTMPIAPA